MATIPNVDAATVDSFGKEWSAFDQRKLAADEHRRLFDAYFADFPLEAHWEGFDLGCGSGRWAELAAPQVRHLHCIDPSPAALDVTRNKRIPRTTCHLACAETMPVGNGSQDFGFCLGVLHHAPDPGRALQAAVRKLKPGAPFLLYLYYALDSRPTWFRALWQVSTLARRSICRLPFPAKVAITTLIAALVYWPLARLSRLTGLDLPLSFYGDCSFYTMRTDALDRFGTPLEQRFTRVEVEAMMLDAGLRDIRFSEAMPRWVAVGRAA